MSEPVKFPDYEINELALQKPERGDYWSEMLCAICLVAGFDKGEVTFFRDRATTYGEQYFTKKEVMSLGDFRDWLSYETKSGTWADVSRGGFKQPEDYYRKPK